MADVKKDWQRRAVDLEAALIDTRDQLRVIARALASYAEGADGKAAGDRDISLVYGAVGLLEQVADGCDRAIMEPLGKGAE